ncbi:MAG: hypothetical protein R2728_09250 [Chitinophagales bacterium]
MQDDVQSLTEASYDAWIKYYRQNENSINNLVLLLCKRCYGILGVELIIMHETDGKEV